MPARTPVRLAALTAAFAGLLFAGDGRSRAQPGKAAAKAKQAEVKVKEAAVLKKAYILLAMGDHTYDGHRVKAMAQVEEAIKILDRSVMATGTKGQKVVAAQQEVAAARAAFIAKHQGIVHESQAASDLQLREAARLLAEVRPALVNHKQPKVREHVDHAIKQVEIALAIR